MKYKLMSDLFVSPMLDNGPNEPPENPNDEVGISAYDIAMEVYSKLWNDNNDMTEQERYDTAFRWLMVEDNDWENPMTGLNAILELLVIMASKHTQPKNTQPA